MDLNDTVIALWIWGTTRTITRVRGDAKVRRLVHDDKRSVVLLYRYKLFIGSTGFGLDRGD